MDQVALLRNRPASTGHIHFSMIALQQDRDGLATMLQKGPYAQPALVPATPWLQAPTVAAPVLRAAATRVRIEPAAGEPAQRWAVWRRVGGAWQFNVLAAQERLLDGAEVTIVHAVDRVGRLSERAIIRAS
jgi:hypothetical protein